MSFMASLPASKLHLLQMTTGVEAPVVHIPVLEGPAARGCHPILSTCKSLKKCPLTTVMKPSVKTQERKCNIDPRPGVPEIYHRSLILLI